MAEVNVGDHVLANFGDGDLLVHVRVVHTPQLLNLQLPDGTIKTSVPHREPEDRDENGPGYTWWHLR